MVGKLVIFKARWLLNIDKFLNRAVEKCTLHIHLISLEVMMSGIG